ncbi:PREDICTED: basic proline-rich protein-like [Chinchilla lanigera]|uniref:basic proline-rich protein-like n=1 Tax=Chinchilla lanigera TaxID=34839 RepID=UPI00038E9C9D|nr:PREDICTED: basic proline-rich protein-like [Chinchilla lanigera]
MERASPLSPAARALRPAPAPSRALGVQRPAPPAFVRGALGPRSPGDASGTLLMLSAAAASGHRPCSCSSRSLDWPLPPTHHCSPAAPGPWLLVSHPIPNPPPSDPAAALHPPGRSPGYAGVASPNPASAGPRSLHRRPPRVSTEVLPAGAACPGAKKKKRPAEMRSSPPLLQDEALEKWCGPRRDLHLQDHHLDQRITTHSPHPASPRGFPGTRRLPQSWKMLWTKLEQPYRKCRNCFFLKRLLFS